eukprot:tig00000882_g5267.t2
MGFDTFAWAWAVVSSPLRLMGGVLVCLVAFLYAWAWYAFVIVSACNIVWPNSPAWAVFHILFFHISYIPMVISYIKTIYANPGIVTPEIVREWQRATTDLGESFERKRDGNARFCRKCNSPKPDRAHHCSICNKCVLKMDHHCPWVCNCVGFYNHKYFVLFILWTEAMCVTIIVLAFPSFMHAINHVSDLVFGGSGAFSLAFVYCLALVFALALGGFGGFHIMLILNNNTTIEMYEQRGSRTIDGKMVWKYDCGRRRNWESVMGTRPLYWFLPTLATVEGDGMHWRIRDDIDLRDLQAVRTTQV